MIISNNLTKKVFDLHPLVGFVHDFEEFLHFLLAKTRVGHQDKAPPADLEAVRVHDRDYI